MRPRRSTVDDYVDRPPLGSIRSGTTNAQSKPGKNASPTVTAVVRNDLGRVITLRSKYRWSPISAYDRPTLFGTQGIAPDLGRVGLKYGDEWHLAHYYNPTGVVKNSIMGGFSGLFDEAAEPVNIVSADAGKTLEKTPATEKLFDFSSEEQVQLTPNEAGLVFVPLKAIGKNPLITTPNNEYSGSAVRLIAETEEIHALIAYIQKLGTDRGRWRSLFEPAEVDGAGLDLPRSDESIARGKEVYERRCIGCHGEKGDGNGEAAAFMHRQKPRNFAFGVYKFKLTKGALPSDRDLLRTITRGVRGTAMPAWYELPLEDRLAVIQYIKYELTADRLDPANPYFFFESEPPGPPLEIGPPPQPTPDLLARGKDIWLQAKCWECHGKTGKGDGEKAPGLKDDWGFPIPPANLTLGQFKSGPYPSDIYRTITMGLSGTPMPAFQGAFPDEDRWALSYYILSLSAFSDPVTGKPLGISEADRAALNDPNLKTPSPDQAYKLSDPLKTAEDKTPSTTPMKSSNAGAEQWNITSN